jgi:hypothetical protein
MEQSLQDQYAPENACFGCGPANREGLHVRSFVRNGEVVAEWQPEPKYDAFPGVLNGGIIGSLLDCHCNWTAAYHLMKNTGRIVRHAPSPRNIRLNFSDRRQRTAQSRSPRTSSI